MHERASTVLQFGSRPIGVGSPSLIVAEVGLNHCGRLELARELVTAAARVGADAIKFQNYRTEDFLSDRTLTYRYRSGEREIEEPQWDMFKRCEAPTEWWSGIKALCDDHGLLFFCTPTSEEGVRQLVDLHVPCLKNGSDFLSHL